MRRGPGAGERRIRAPIGWAALLGTGTIAGIGFTVAILIADRPFTGAELADAKLGALTAAVVSSLLTWIVYRLTALLSPARRARALLGDLRLIQDLIPEVDAERDHIPLATRRVHHRHRVRRLRVPALRPG